MCALRSTKEGLLRAQSGHILLHWGTGSELLCCSFPHALRGNAVCEMGPLLSPAEVCVPSAVVTVHRGEEAGVDIKGPKDDKPF